MQTTTFDLSKVKYHHIEKLRYELKKLSRAENLARRRYKREKI